MDTDTMTEGRTLIGWECEDCDEALGDNPRMWDLAEKLRKEHEAETGHSTTVRVIEEQRILPSQGDRMEIGESMLEIAEERHDRIEWICPECERTGEELNSTKRCPNCDERLREVFP